MEGFLHEQLELPISVPLWLCESLCHLANEHSTGWPAEQSD